MATLYFVRGWIKSYPKEEFVIRVDKREGYERTPKTYSKKGSRVLLSDIGRLEDTFHIQITVDDENAVEDAKTRIMDYLMSKYTKEMAIAESKFKAVEKYRIDSMKLVDLVRDKDCTHEELTMIDAQRGYCNNCGSKVTLN